MGRGFAAKKDSTVRTPKPQSHNNVSAAWIPQPSLDRDHPAAILHYRDAQQWLHENIARQRFPNGVTALILHPRLHSDDSTATILLPGTRLDDYAGVALGRRTWTEVEHIWHPTDRMWANPRYNTLLELVGCRCGLHFGAKWCLSVTLWCASDLHSGGLERAMGFNRFHNIQDKYSM